MRWHNCGGLSRRQWVYWPLLLYGHLWLDISWRKIRNWTLGSRWRSAPLRSLSWVKPPKVSFTSSTSKPSCELHYLYVLNYNSSLWTPLTSGSQRKVYPTHPGDDFWDEVDKFLSHILKRGKTTYEKQVHLYKSTSWFSRVAQSDDRPPYLGPRKMWGGHCGHRSSLNRKLNHFL